MVAFYLSFSSIIASNNVLKRGCRIALRSKVNDCLMGGLTLVDSILPVGRGQRQLILGDRYTGKTSIFLCFLITSNTFNLLGSIDGFGTQRLFGLYIGMNQNLSKLSKFICLSFSLILASHSSSSSLLSFMLPSIGVSIVERLRDRGFDGCICFDDLSKHSKCYRQISLILAKIPSRDAFPADIFNIHSSLLERCGKLKYSYFGGSITAFPVIETIHSDITEYIATNVISITDGQFYTNKRLFLDSCRPAIDSGLSVSRIGSNAQCKLMKVVSVGIKNLLTNYRIMELSSFDFFKLLSLNLIFFQDHLLIYPIETSLILLLVFRNGFLFKYRFQIYRFVLMLSFDFLYLYYILFISKHSYSLFIWCLIWGFFQLLGNLRIFPNHSNVPL